MPTDSNVVSRDELVAALGSLTVAPEWEGASVVDDDSGMLRVYLSDGRAGKVFRDTLVGEVRGRYWRAEGQPGVEFKGRGWRERLYTHIVADVNAALVSVSRKAQP